MIGNGAGAAGMIDCTVIGGGVAGLLAACELARQGASVLLIEARPRLGGRASSFRDPHGVMPLDNGQHLLMGCYTATLSFLRRMEVDNLLLRVDPPDIAFAQDGGRRARLRTRALPHPLGFAAGLLGFRMLPPMDRLRALRAILTVRALTPAALDALDAVTAEQWLASLRQSRAAMDALWRPLLLATMNAEGREASAKLFARVMREMYAGSREAAIPLIPRASLHELFVAPVVDVFTVRRQQIRAHAQVAQMQPLADGGWNVHVRNRTPVATRSVIAAIPPWSLDALLERSGLRLPAFDASAFEPSEIMSVHVWTRRPVTEHPMTALLGTRLQWYFPRPNDGGLWHGSCTVSAAQHVLASREEAEEAVRSELPRCFPALRDADIARMLVLRERRATFIPKPGLETKRPGARSGIPGLYLAGDWTGTGLPATIESAARSAEAAAATVLSSLR